MPITTGGGTIVLSFKHENTINYLKKERKHEKTNPGIFLEADRFGRKIIELHEAAKEEACLTSRCVNFQRVQHKRVIRQ